MNREDGLVAAGSAEMTIEDYLDSEGGIAIPAGVTLTSFMDRNVADLGDMPSYRYLDFEHDCTVELSWAQLGARVRAVGARLQQVTRPGDRVAILAPQGVDYVVGFFAADPGRQYRGAAVRPGTAGSRGTSRRGPPRCGTGRGADHHRLRRSRRHVPASYRGHGGPG